MVYLLFIINYYQLSVSVLGRVSDHFLLEFPKQNGSVFEPILKHKGILLFIMSWSTDFNI